MSNAVRVGRVVFANPVLAASGTFEFGLKFPEVSRRLGGVVTKGVTLEPRAGNPPPRIAEFPGGILNSVGLENPGVAALASSVLPPMRRLGTRVIVNIAGFKPAEFGRLVDLLEEHELDGYELNLSCPNVEKGGAGFGQSARLVGRITADVRRRTGRTVIVKLTANFVDPAETARAAEDSGADAVTVINTLYGLVLDENCRPFLGGRTGGISGPALKPFALYCVDRVAGRVKVPVIGCGGIASGWDALEFLARGAKMVQVGTANLANPRAALDVWLELRSLLPRKKELPRKREKHEGDVVPGSAGKSRTENLSRRDKKHGGGR